MSASGLAAQVNGQLHSADGHAWSSRCADGVEHPIGGIEREQFRYEKKVSRTGTCH